MFRTVLIAGLSVLALSPLTACSKKTLPPGGANICWHVGQSKDGSLKFNKMGDKVMSLERCMADLEAMRIKFLQMGGSNREITGAYQGNFIFVDRRGFFTAPNLEAHRYLALVRSGDGRLVVPGAMPQQQGQ